MSDIVTSHCIVVPQLATTSVSLDKQVLRATLVRRLIEIVDQDGQDLVGTLSLDRYKNQIKAQLLHLEK